MNTDALARLYDRLTPSERLPLILAAADRGDDAEVQRLVHAARRVHLSLPDHHGLSDGLVLLALVHRIEQLDLGLLFWHALGVVAHLEAFPLGKQDQPRLDRLWDGIRLAAYRFCMKADGYRRLCAELQIEPGALLRGVRGSDAVQLTEQAARALCGSPEAAAATWRRRFGPEHAPPPTAEGAARALRAILDSRLAWWDADNG
jgi:hypothetical protein